MSAMRTVQSFIGRRLLSFLSRTTDAAAAFRAVSINSGFRCFLLPDSHPDIGKDRRRDPTETSFQGYGVPHCRWFFRYFAFFDELRKILDICGAGHIHIHSGIDCKFGRLFFVLCHTVWNQLVDTRIIAHYETRKAPLLAKDIGQQPSACRCGNTVYLIEGSHDRTYACLYCSPIRFQIHIPKGMFR